MTPTETDEARQLPAETVSHDVPGPTGAASIADVPTARLAINTVGMLIRCKGNLNLYEEVIAMLIRELRGEAAPEQLIKSQRPEGK